MTLDLVVIGVRILPLDAGAGQVTGKLVQVECDLQPLLTGYPPVAFELSFEGLGSVCE